MSEYSEMRLRYAEAECAEIKRYRNDIGEIGAKNLVLMGKNDKLYQKLQEVKDLLQAWNDQQPTDHNDATVNPLNFIRQLEEILEGPK